MTVSKVKGIPPRLFASLEDELNNDNFEFYSQKGGKMRKASADKVRGYMAPDYISTPLGGVPSTSGNTENLNEFVIDSNADC